MRHLRLDAQGGAAAALSIFSIFEAKATGNNIKKAKGVKNNAVKKHIRYEKASFEKRTFHDAMNVLRSEKHYIYGQHLNKVSLSPSESKRWIADNGVDKLAYGHVATRLYLLAICS